MFKFCVVIYQQYRNYSIDFTLWFFTSLTMIPTVIISLYEKTNANATNLLTAPHLNLVKLHLVYYHINFFNTVTIEKVLPKCLQETLLCTFSIHSKALFSTSSGRSHFVKVLRKILLISLDTLLANGTLTCWISWNLLIRRLDSQNNATAVFPVSIGSI